MITVLGIRMLLTLNFKRGQRCSSKIPRSKGWDTNVAMSPSYITLQNMIILSKCTIVASIKPCAFYKEWTIACICMPNKCLMHVIFKNPTNWHPSIYLLIEVNLEWEERWRSLNWQCMMMRMSSVFINT